MPMAERPGSGQSPSRYMMYRSDAEHNLLAPTLMAQAPPHPSAAAAPAPAAMYPFPMAMHPDPAAMARMPPNAIPNGYTMVPFTGAYPMMDAQSLPMMMQMTNIPPYSLPSQERPPEMDARHDSFSETWGSISSDTSQTMSTGRVPNMDDLLALSRQAQLDGEGGPNANVFVCPHCEKRYVGKHARSIWRRHLQDKHAIPLSVQPRRTRWDRDANRPRNAAERRERMLESKRRWARKKREQERRAAAAERAAANGSEPPASVASKESTPAPTSMSTSSSTKPVSPLVTKVAPTPPRSVLTMRDQNVPVSSRSSMAMTKSPGFLDNKLYMPSSFQSTPLRGGNAHAIHGHMPSPSDARHAPDSARRGLALAPPSSLTKRTSSDRAALAAFTRIDPTPRMSSHGLSRTNEMPASPTVRSMKASRESRGDQFSSPQHLNLTQSLGLAPHSATKGHGGFTSMYPSNVNMTPMGASGTPFGRMPMGLTPTISGLLRGSGADMTGSGLLGGSDLSGYMMGLSAMESPRMRSVRRTPRRSGVSFHSSSERDDDDDLDQDGEMRIISPSLRQRVRGNKPSPQDTPSKVAPPKRVSASTPLGPRRTPGSVTRLR